MSETPFDPSRPTVLQAADVRRTPVLGAAVGCAAAASILGWIERGPIATAIVVALWLWVDLNEELADMPPWRALPLSLRIWRWALTFLALPSVALAATALRCAGPLRGQAACQVWLEAPLGLHGQLSQLLAFVFGGTWTPGVAAFFGYVALGAYVVGILQWLVVRLPRQGRVAGGF